MKVYLGILKVVTDIRILGVRFTVFFIPYIRAASHKMSDTNIDVNTYIK